jgi:hypothetical protein
MVLTQFSTQMLWPMVAMAGLTIVAWMIMGRRRLGAIAAGRVPIDDFKGDKDPGLPGAAAIATRHFGNHFEVPVLFHVVCLLHIVFGVGGPFAAALAWGFVAFRALHTWEHLGRNDVPWRFRFYASSTLIVWVLWVELAVRIAIA